MPSGSWVRSVSVMWSAPCRIIEGRPMAGRLDRKRCLIVGGTSGIGLAAAERFLEEGARIVIAGLPGAQSLLPAGSASVIACDASVPTQVESLFQQVVSHLGG